jgi:prepilin-type N-terminal cleavage/methylation domain-containing protein
MNCDSAFLTKKKDKEKGFTLLEVIVAISVLTIGLLAVASMQVLAIKGNTLAFGVTEATSWASDQMEKLMFLPYDHANLIDTDGDGTDEDVNGDGVDDDGGEFGLEDTVDPQEVITADHPPETQGRYTIYWNIAVDVGADSTKTVNVIVTWTDHGIQKRISIRNIIPST